MELTNEQKSDRARGIGISGHVRGILRVGHDPAAAVQDRAVAGFDYDALRAPCHPVLRARALETVQA
ncbi:MAG: hypothetical protein JWL90_3173 [Chthoniobacteraceae bacterium]|nr:hypothetical protein [Chthoniobacteraceae bacterium]